MATGQRVCGGIPGHAADQPVFLRGAPGKPGGLILDAGDFHLKAPENLKACLAPYAGKKVDLGIRPSDFELCQGGENAIRAHVDSIEPLAMPT